MRSLPELTLVPWCHQCEHLEHRPGPCPLCLHGHDDDDWVPMKTEPEVAIRDVLRVPDRDLADAG